MGAAVWSSTATSLRTFPPRFLVQFFHNHGFLRVEDRPQWLTLRGGSRSYIEPLTRPFADRIRLEAPVTGLQRTPDGVVLSTAKGGEERFDGVVLATRADTSLRLLSDATPWNAKGSGPSASRPTLRCCTRTRP